MTWALATGISYSIPGEAGNVTGTVTCTTTATNASPVGTYPITSCSGLSDNGFTVNRFELGGADVFDDGAAALLDFSPLRHAAAITTPLLLIHGEDDYRCPIEQSEQLFVALRRLGVPTRFVRFPGESHNLATGGRPR